MYIEREEALKRIEAAKAFTTCGMGCHIATFDFGVWVQGRSAALDNTSDLFEVPRDVASELRLHEKYVEFGGREYLPPVHDSRCFNGGKMVFVNKGV